MRILIALEQFSWFYRFLTIHFYLFVHCYSLFNICIADQLSNFPFKRTTCWIFAPSWRNHSEIHFLRITTSSEAQGMMTYLEWVSDHHRVLAMRRCNKVPDNAGSVTSWQERSCGLAGLDPLVQRHALSACALKRMEHGIEFFRLAHISRDLSIKYELSARSQKWKSGRVLPPRATFVKPWESRKWCL